MNLDPRYHALIASLGYRADAGESLAIARSLDHIEQRITEVMYAELRALRFVPTIPGIDPGAKTYTFTVLDRSGRAAKAGSRGKDLPRGNESLGENTSGIETYGAEYAYTTAELRAVAQMNTGRGPTINLETIRATTAAQMIARAIDSVVAFGDPDRATGQATIKGFLNNGNVTIESAPLAWADMTPDELLAELFALANNPFVISKELFRPDAILLPTAHHQLVSTLPYGTAGLKTVLGFFNDAMANAKRSVAVESWPLLVTADAARTGPRAVSYVRSAEVAGAIVPAAFIAQPPQAQGLEWVIPCEGICGGAAVCQPLGMYYRDGLGAIS